MAVVCHMCTSGCTSRNICKSNLNLELCQTSQPVCRRLVDHQCELLQSLVWLVASYEGKQAIRLQPLKGNDEPLQAAKTAKSSQNSISNIDINTDVHTQTLPCTSKHRHTVLFSFHYDLCFWLKTVQIAYSCGFDPRGGGAAVQTHLERCEIQPHLLWQKPTTSTEAECVCETQLYTYFNSFMLHLIEIFFSELNRAYCIKTVQCFVDICFVKYGLPGGSMATDNIMLIPLSVCGVWIISREASSFTETQSLGTTYFILRIKFPCDIFNVSLWVMVVWKREREKAICSKRL